MSSATILVARPEIIRMSPVIRKFERRGMENIILREERKAQPQKSLNSEEIIRTGTRITRIGRIYTDPCVSVSSASSAQSVFYRTPPIIDDDKKPQINADKRRFVTLTHCKECEERKAEEQKSLRSLRLINFHGLPTAQGNKATVVFQTGFTGSTGW
ncbi:MAG: hypothetical protein KKA10_08140 [Euryarchaeota archaeon]|nr:hypothetical protein [Euryarchaeota archaeon]MCG2737376.1 hypothetical protein [Candidatus Methanoperedenaceae archaeon]